MRTKRREYQGQQILITFDLKRCVHAAVCLQQLPSVFNLSARPWIQVDGASADKIASVIESCPSGALHYERFDGGPAEVPDRVSSVIPIRNGPLYVRGDLSISIEEGDNLRETRAALCRCGESQNKPFCDNSHRKINFRVEGA